MERTILFRGQFKRPGEDVRMNGSPMPSVWAYGGIFPGDGDFSIIYGNITQDQEDFRRFKSSPRPGDGFDKWTVYSATVGQYTGVDDVAGNQIFEGDIVAAKGLDQAKVVWHPKAARWALARPDEVVICWLSNADNIQVVGNIYDTPELLADCQKEEDRIVEG